MADPTSSQTTTGVAPPATPTPPSPSPAPAPTSNLDGVRSSDPTGVGATTPTPGGPANYEPFPWEVGHTDSPAPAAPSFLDPTPAASDASNDRSGSMPAPTSPVADPPSTPQSSPVEETSPNQEKELTFPSTDLSSQTTTANELVPPPPPPSLEPVPGDPPPSHPSPPSADDLAHQIDNSPPAPLGGDTPKPTLADITSGANSPLSPSGTADWSVPTPPSAPPPPTPSPPTETPLPSPTPAIGGVRSSDPTGIGAAQADTLPPITTPAPAPAPDPLPPAFPPSPAPIEPAAVLPLTSPGAEPPSPATPPTDLPLGGSDTTAPAPAVANENLPPVTPPQGAVNPTLAAAAVASPPAMGAMHEESTKKGGGWLWIVIILIVVAALAGIYFLGANYLASRTTTTGTTPVNTLDEGVVTPQEDFSNQALPSTTTGTEVLPNP